jgi:hypothetical protein
LPPGPFQPGGGGSSQNTASEDPNGKFGPAGFGPQGFTTGDHAFPYRIDFENDPTASAPAQIVTVTDALDPNLDWNTFALTEVGFGDTHIPIPVGSQHFQTTVDTSENGKTFQVQIELGLNAQTGKVFANIYSIDPATGLPPDVLTGFLPPEDGTGRGMGYFSYTVRPKAGLPTGTRIRNVATITFDANPAITTDQVDDHDPGKGTDPTREALATIDAGPPTSRVNPLPAVSNAANFQVSWSGADDFGGSGVRSYDVYVSADGGAFTPWLTDTTRTSATYAGAYGHTYAFSSVATDNVGNREGTPAEAQATTALVELPPPPPPPPPSPIPPPSARGITARLITVKAGKKKHRLMVDVFFADTGAMKAEFVAPFQKPTFKAIQVSVRDSNGDGVPDQVVVTARKGRRSMTAVFAG